jgi:hypothetical protein
VKRPYFLQGVGATSVNSGTCCLRRCLPHDDSRKLKHVAGLAFGADGCFYTAERKAKRIRKFGPAGHLIGDFITELPDEPEFLLHVKE